MAWAEARRAYLAERRLADPTDRADRADVLLGLAQLWVQVHSLKATCTKSVAYSFIYVDGVYDDGEGWSFHIEPDGRTFDRGRHTSKWNLLTD